MPRESPAFIQRVRSGDRRLRVGFVAVITVASIYLLLSISPERWVDISDLKASSPRWRISVALADTAVIFLATTLSVGPVRVLRGGRPTIHLPSRRTIGVASAILALTHLLVALSIHGSILRPWEQFFAGPPTFANPIFVLRNKRGIANWLGASSITTLLVLAVLSRSSWQRRLGTVRWKTAQRAIYLVFVAITLHAVVYWQVERRLVLHQLLLLLPIAAATCLQITAATTVARSRRQRPSPAHSVDHDTP